MPNIISKYTHDKIEFGNSPWILDLSGPQSILESYSNIFIKGEYKLIGYVFSSTYGSDGYVYAVPKDFIGQVQAPDASTTQDGILLNLPKPMNSLDDFMMAIEGDKTPLSYLQAAVLYHELCEYGASWHSISWGRDIILPIEGNLDGISNYEWDMFKEEPDIINPHFYYDENNVPVVVFYTINDIGTVSLKEYIHTFEKNSYTLKVAVNYIAEAGMGIIF